MKYKIFLEWDNDCGIFYTELYPLEECLENAFKDKQYGKSIKEIGVVLSCRRHDFKQRKRFKKAVGRFEYDILLDFFLIRNVKVNKRKNLFEGKS